MKAKLLLALPFLVPAWFGTLASADTLQVKGGTVSVDVAAQQMSRILVKGEKITAVRSLDDPPGPQVLVQNDTTTGDVFVGFDGDTAGRTFSLFVTTDAGETVQVLLHPGEGAAKTIELVPELKATTQTGAVSLKTNGYAETVTAFMKLMFNSQVTDGVTYMDVTQKPFCFVNLGGISISPGIGYGQKTSVQNSDGRGDRTAYHVHYYVYPLLAWMEILTDFACMEQGGFDVAYITEFDPLWNSDELAAIINPEVFLFSNPIAVMACSADCVAATATGRPIQELFWCAGCQGSLYPMTGQVTGEYGPLPGALQVAERFNAKMHRELLAMGTRGSLSLCSPIVQPTMDKLQYRYQEIYPVAHKGRLACNAIGKSTVPYEAGKVYPVKGEDIGFLIWRKRNCCAL